MLKFLIRHKARLSVTDSQGRLAAHLVCASTSPDSLKLANFADRPPSLTEQLVPKKRSRAKPDGGEEEREDSFHREQAGDEKDVNILELLWKCIECNDGFSLCFKCFIHRSDLPNPEHNFKDMGPLYREDKSVAESVEGPDKQEETSGDEQEPNSQDTVEIGLDEVDLEDLDLDLEDDNN
ncbi:hypothetical protein ACHAP5_011329 [Fusarium lateritium]